MGCGDVVESRPFTRDTVAAVYGAGFALVVPGRFNVLLRVTCEVSIPDVRIGIGPTPLLQGDLVGPGRWIECYIPFSDSQTDHQFLVQGTAPGDGAISFTFGRIHGPTC